MRIVLLHVREICFLGELRDPVFPPPGRICRGASVCYRLPASRSSLFNARLVSVCTACYEENTDTVNIVDEKSEVHNTISSSTLVAA